MIADEEPKGVTATMALITKKDATVPVTVQTRTALSPEYVEITLVRFTKRNFKGRSRKCL